MLDLTNWLTSSQDYFRNMGWGGVALWVGLIVVVQLFLGPLSPVAITGGFIFGMWRGLIAITLGTAAGAALNFILARHVARRAVARRLKGSEKFRLIDVAIGREGWKIIALLRFCPIPFGFANFAYGLTAIRFWPYFLATIVAIIPGNVCFVWLGATAHAGLEVALGAERPRHTLEYVFLVVGLCAAATAMFYITRVARAAVIGATAQPASRPSMIGQSSREEPNVNLRQP
jgi:uncharacterized membrane protein YdjX (TVP38/TMEM64 family)